MVSTMETKNSKQVISQALKVLGIIVSIVGLIVFILGIGGLFMHLEWLWTWAGGLLDPVLIIVLGLHMWTIGAIIDKYKTMTKKQRKSLTTYFVLLVCGVTLWMASNYGLSINDKWEYFDTLGVVFTASSWAAAVHALRDNE